jgi:hypothetical protein
VGKLSEYLKKQWPNIREQLLREKYQPAQVREVQFTKQAGPGVRKGWHSNGD